MGLEGESVCGKDGVAQSVALYKHLGFIGTQSHSLGKRTPGVIPFYHAEH